jgi:methylated-DNA-protein-cysteine methyltransferase related protein
VAGSASRHSFSSKPAQDARIAGIIDRIRDIPYGHVQTYGDIEPGAPRLVGRVLATTRERNLPWYRVVRADGSMAKGEKQRALLVAEGVPMRGDRVDVRFARA